MFVKELYSKPLFTFLNPFNFFGLMLRSGSSIDGTIIYEYLFS